MTQTKQPKTGSKFTPGPWIAQIDEKNCTAINISSALREEMLANLRLAIKAPEMYELLDSISFLSDPMCPDVNRNPKLLKSVVKTARRIKAAIDGTAEHGEG